MTVPSSTGSKRRWTSSVERLTYRLTSASPGRLRWEIAGRSCRLWESFNLFNRSVLPDCNVPITNPNQLLVPAGALGDFLGPGTAVGIPFAAQLGVRATF